jgi:hypothetical protein
MHRTSFKFSYKQTVSSLPKLEDYATPYDLGDGMLDEFEEGAAAEPLCDGLLGHHGMELEDW